MKRNICSYVEVYAVSYKDVNAFFAAGVNGGPPAAPESRTAYGLSVFSEKSSAGSAFFMDRTAETADAQSLLCSTAML